MALRLRRGTNAERLLVTPKEGELIYTTDTKLIFAGDGSQIGGNVIAGLASVLADTTPQLGGNLDLNSKNITGVGNINIDGTITAPQFEGNLHADDSTVAYDSATQQLIVHDITTSGHIRPSSNNVRDIGSSTAKFRNGYLNTLQVGTLVGSVSVTGTLTAGLVDSDLTGSVFGDDSSILVDGINGSIHASEFVPANSIVNISTPSAAATSVKQRIISQDNDSELILTRKSTSDLSASAATFGTITFQRDDSGGEKSGAIIIGNRNSLYLMADSAGSFADASLAVTLTDGKLAVGSFGPATEKLEVTGNVKASGFIMPGVYATTSARDTAHASPANGQIIYLTATHKFQGYANSAWVNLN